MKDPADFVPNKVRRRRKRRIHIIVSIVAVIILYFCVIALLNKRTENYVKYYHTNNVDVLHLKLSSTEKNYNIHYDLLEKAYYNKIPWTRMSTDTIGSYLYYHNFEIYAQYPNKDSLHQAWAKEWRESGLTNNEEWCLKNNYRFRLHRSNVIDYMFTRVDRSFYCRYPEIFECVVEKVDYSWEIENRYHVILKNRRETNAKSYYDKMGKAARKDCNLD